VVHRSEGVRVTGCPEERDLDGPRVASLGGRLLVQRADGPGQVAKGEPDRYPTVAVVDDAREALARRAPQDDRRMRLLERLGGLPGGIEVDEFALVLRCLLGPDALHRLDAFPQDRPAMPEVGAVIAHLLDVPACPDAEQHTSVRQLVERRDLLGGRDRIAFYEQADAG